MEKNHDPRFHIYANLDEVQQEIEKAAKDRKSEIKDEIRDQKKSLKDEMKDLKSEADDSYKDYKNYKDDSDDPVASEKISTAKEASKVIKKSIELDYEDSIDMVDREGDRRMDSIDRMLDDSDEAIEARRRREIRDNREPSNIDALISGEKDEDIKDKDRLSAKDMRDNTDTLVGGAAGVASSTAIVDAEYLSGRDVIVEREDIVADKDDRRYKDNLDLNSDDPKLTSTEILAGGTIAGAGQVYGNNTRREDNLHQDNKRHDDIRNNEIRGNAIRNNEIGSRSDATIGNDIDESDRPDYIVRETLITDDNSDDFILIREEADLRQNYEVNQGRDIRQDSKIGQAGSMKHDNMQHDNKIGQTDNLKKDNDLNKKNDNNPRGNMC